MAVNFGKNKKPPCLEAAEIIYWFKNRFINHKRCQFLQARYGRLA